MSQKQRLLHTGPRTPAAFLLVAAALGSSLVLGGCRNSLDAYGARVLSDPEKKHAIHFSAEIETLYVELPDGRSGLSRNQAADVRRFIERFKAESNGSLHIAAPRAAGGRIAIARPMRQIEDIAHHAGIPSRVIQVNDYSGHNPDFGPAVRVSYRRPVAQPPYCEDWSADLGVDRERLPHRDFGCATQRNLALTVANARDLQHPQYPSPRSSERRSVTWTEYVGGESGSSDSSVSGGAGSPEPAATQ